MRSTVITISHRLITVLHYDTIVVLSEGRILERGSPGQLLADRHSHFYSMAADAGLVQSYNLISTCSESHLQNGGAKNVAHVRLEGRCDRLERMA